MDPDSSTSSSMGAGGPAGPPRRRAGAMRTTPRRARAADRLHATCTPQGGAREWAASWPRRVGPCDGVAARAVVGTAQRLGRDGIPLLERGFDRLHAMVPRRRAPRDRSIAGTGRRVRARARARHGRARGADEAPVRLPAPRSAGGRAQASVAPMEWRGTRTTTTSASRAAERCASAPTCSTAVNTPAMSRSTAPLWTALGAFRNAMGRWSNQHASA